MRYFTIILSLVTFCGIMAFAGIESIFIKGIKFTDNGKEYLVTTYKSIDPWIVMDEVYVPGDQVVFLKTLNPPIWITFKNREEIGSILSEGKRMKGSNLKEEEKQKILKFREYLEK